MELPTGLGAEAALAAAAEADEGVAKRLDALDDAGAGAGGAGGGGGGGRRLIWIEGKVLNVVTKKKKQ